MVACRDKDPTFWATMISDAASEESPRAEDAKISLWRASPISTSIFSDYLFNIVAKMATTTLPTATQDADLTDEQVGKMLARATQRLEEGTDSTALARKDEVQTYTFPKLQTGQLAKAYVSSTGDVATLDQKRLLEDKPRKGANGIRKVEDPMASKKAASEVRQDHTYHLHSPCTAMMKTFPIFSLSGARAPSWSPFCLMRDYYQIIVTLSLYISLHSATSTCL